MALRLEAEQNFIQTFILNIKIKNMQAKISL